METKFGRLLVSAQKTQLREERTISQRVDCSIRSCSFRPRTGKGRTNPGERDVVGAKHPADHQEEGEIPWSSLCSSGGDDEA